MNLLIAIWLLDFFFIDFINKSRISYFSARKLSSFLIFIKKILAQKILKKFSFFPKNPSLATPLPESSQEFF